MYEEHLKTCEHCQKQKGASSLTTTSKPTIYVKSASSYNKHKKLGELGAIIRGTSYPSLEPLFQTKTKGASEAARKPGPIEREVKLKELGKMIKGL